MYIFAEFEKTEINLFSNLVVLPIFEGSIVFNSSAIFSSNIYPEFQEKDVVFYGTIENSKQSERITSLVQQSVVLGLVTLFTLDLNHIGMGTLRFTTEITKDYKPLSFGNKEYFPVPVVADGFEKKSQGSQARPTLKLSAQSIEITSLLLSGEGLQGAKVSRIRTFSRFLDDGEEPDGTVIISKEDYIIDRISEWKAGDYVIFELINALDMESITIPNLRISKYYCDKVYRIYNAKDEEFIMGQYNPCPYIGSNYYNIKNEIMTLPNEDICNKTINACELRFGKGSILPFGGFPGTAPQGR